MIRLFSVFLLSLLLLSGCAKPEQEDGIQNQTETMPADEEKDGPPLDSDIRGATPIADSDTQASPLQQDTLTAQELMAKLEDQGSPLASRVIYFEYDSAKVSDESLATLEAHGNFIAGSGNIFVRLEGHADERGSREYNIALGDRRAQSVRRILLFQGASSDQLDTISYGEERPAEIGHDEAAWGKNRRVELVYEVR
jgi:peptidoglycan-associated lipoprotein